MAEPSLPVPSSIEIARRLAALAGLAGLTAGVLFWATRPHAFWRGYLFAWLLWASVTLGSLLLTAFDQVIGWDAGSRAVLRAGGRTAPLVVVLAVPLAFCGSEAAGWMRAVSTTAPAEAIARLIVVGPTLAALALLAVVLPSLSREEPAVLPAAISRMVRRFLVVVLTTHATFTLAFGWTRLPPSSLTLPACELTLEVTAAELAIVVWLLTRHGLVIAGACAFAAHATLVYGLLPRAAVFSGDAAWLAHGLALLLLTALGGLWLALFLWRLDRLPPPPLEPFVDTAAPSKPPPPAKSAGPW